VNSPPVAVRIFGSLRLPREAQGLPVTLDVDVPAEGISGRALAALLGIPPETVEGVFVNHTVYGLGHLIRPGDRVALVPPDTPGPHRVFLGLYAAGQSDDEDEDDTGQEPQEG
jgi:hypothetical protein